MNNDIQNKRRTFKIKMISSKKQKLKNIFDVYPDIPDKKIFGKPEHSRPKNSKIVRKKTPKAIEGSKEKKTTKKNIFFENLIQKEAEHRRFPNLIKLKNNDVRTMSKNIELAHLKKIELEDSEFLNRMTDSDVLEIPVHFPLYAQADYLKKKKNYSSRNSLDNLRENALGSTRTNLKPSFRKSKTLEEVIIFRNRLGKGTKKKGGNRRLLLEDTGDEIEKHVRKRRRANSLDSMSCYRDFRSYICQLPKGKALRKKDILKILDECFD